MCSPCGPMVCYKYEDCGPPKGKSAEGASGVEESGGQKKDEKENQLKRTKSRELRGGIMYYSCHCIKRNGLQHDCRRTGCGGEPACLTMPDPVCAPSQLARARGLADPAALAAHIHAQGGGSNSGTGGASDVSSASGKRFIVCELKGITPEISADKSGKCCKCPTSMPVLSSQQTSSLPVAGACILASVPLQQSKGESDIGQKCHYKCDPMGISADKPSVIVFNEQMINKIISSFEKKEVKRNEDDTVRAGGRSHKVTKTIAKEEPCTRPGCIHWQPPPPCVWDAPCKADCFETPPGIQPGRNPLTGGGGGSRVVESGGGLGPGTSSRSGQGAVERPREIMKLLTPTYCAGCSSSGGGASAAVSSGGPAPGIPMLVMKLC